MSESSSVPPATVPPPVGTVAVVPSVLVFFVSFCMFVAVFNVSWHVSSTFKIVRHHFRSFPLAKKADWCSRVNSTVHGLIIVPGCFFAVLAVQWRDNYEPYSFDDLTTIHCFVAFSVAYFAMDLVVIVLYRVPSWMVFATHHVVAMIPLSVNTFDPSCPTGAYVVALFLLVELPTISLNIQVFLEQIGKADTRLYASLFYVTYVTWIFCRLALPVYLLWVIWWHVYPNNVHVACLRPAMVCAHVITIFCFAVFYFVLTKEVRLRWKTAPHVTDCAVVTPDVENGHVPMGTHNTGYALVIPQEEDSATDFRPESPKVPPLQPITRDDIEWGLGIERPASVMHYGESVLR
eukprot:PhM_4_TR13025/c0_g1_i1/m.36503